MSNEITQEERELIVDVIRNSKEHIDECEMRDILFNTNNCDNLTCRECRINVNKKLAALIESATSQPDGIPYPLDKDGVPIKIGEIVYSDSGNKYVVISILIDKGYSVSATQDGCFLEYFHCPETELSHKNPRTLKDIVSDIMYSTEEGASDDPEKEVNERVHEAYEMGRKAAENE